MFTSRDLYKSDLENISHFSIAKIAQKRIDQQAYNISRYPQLLSYKGELLNDIYSFPPCQSEILLAWDPSF